jgi:hypothetical protein
VRHAFPRFFAANSPLDAKPDWAQRGATGRVARRAGDATARPQLRRHPGNNRPTSEARLGPSTAIVGGYRCYS